LLLPQLLQPLKHFLSETEIELSRATSVHVHKYTALLLCFKKMNDLVNEVISGRKKPFKDRSKSLTLDNNSVFKKNRHGFMLRLSRKDFEAWWDGFSG